MTVPNTTNEARYTATGSEASFPYTFRIFSKSDLVVQTQAPGLAPVTLVLDTDYTVTGVLEYSGGTVVLTAGNLTAGYTFLAYRDPAQVQDTSLQDQGTYRATTVEDALDLLTMETQSVQRQATVAIHAPAIDNAPSMQLPVAALRANTFPAFDGNGNLIVSGGPSSIPASGIVQQVANIAALKLYLVPVAGYLVQTEGYYTAGDLGSGLYVWNASDTTADNGGTVIAITGTATGRWNMVYNGWFTAKQFGAKGNGTTDDLVAINAAIAAANALGGEVVFFAPGTYIHSAAITMAANVTIMGAGRITSVLKSAHVGDGITMTSPINSSTAVNTIVRDIGLWNTNASNTAAGYDDVGGTYVTLNNVRIRGFKYGIIFDQTELADVVRCDLETNLLAGIWLVNGSEHTGGAGTGFTNRIGVKECQFNEGAAAWGIIDDGGTSHEVYDNNFNGCLSHVRIAGTQNFHMRDNECESAASSCVYQTNLGIAGGSKGAAVNSLFVCNAFVPVAGQSCVTLVNGSPVTFIQNLFGNTSAIKVVGVNNCFNASFIDNFNAGGGATYTSGATHMFTQDPSGTTISAAGVGTAITAHISATAALSFGVPGSVPGALDLTVTVTGADLGDTVTLGLGATLPANYLTCAWVSGANTVTVRLLQFAGAATAQNLGTCRADVWKH